MQGMQPFFCELNQNAVIHVIIYIENIKLRIICVGKFLKKFDFSMSLSEKYIILFNGIIVQ